MICSTAAFALAVIEFPLRGLVFMIMVVSFLIPFDAIAVPLFGIMRDMRLQNTYTGLILPGVGNGLAVFLLRQFFLGIPKELREAGRGRRPRAGSASTGGSICRSPGPRWSAPR